MVFKLSVLILDRFIFPFHFKEIGDKCADNDVSVELSKEKDDSGTPETRVHTIKTSLHWMTKELNESTLAGFIAFSSAIIDREVQMVAAASNDEIQWSKVWKSSIESIQNIYT